MGYPVSYRHGAQRYGDGSFQEPAPNRRPYQDPMHPPYKDPPPPANDPWPAPANDNEPRGRYRHPRFPKLPPWPGPAPRGVSGSFPRRPGLPWQVDLAFDLASAYYQYSVNVKSFPVITLSPEWKVRCGPTFPSSGYSGRYAFGVYDNNPGVCGLRGQALSGMTPGWPIVKPDDTGVLLAKFNDNRSVPRWFNVMQWYRTLPTSSVTVGYPALGPFAGKAVPQPLPATKVAPLPAYVPAPWGYEVPMDKPMPATLPSRPDLYMGGVRSARPVGRLDPGVPGVVIVPDNPLPPRRPPGKVTKERKVTERVPGYLANALGKAAGVYESAKFANDIVNAFYDALPGKKSAKTPQDKLIELYRRYDEVDVNRAINGVLMAVAMERAGAYIDRARRTASKNLGLHMHIQIPTGGGPHV